MVLRNRSACAPVVGSVRIERSNQRRLKLIDLFGQARIHQDVDALLVFHIGVHIHVSPAGKIFEDAIPDVLRLANV